MQTLGRRDVLVVGDSKMAALSTRGHIVAGGSAYLCSYSPLGPSTELTDWVEQALAHQTDPAAGGIRTVAVIHEWSRPQAWLDDASEDLHQWIERVLVVRSEQRRQGLIDKSQERLARLTRALEVLGRPAGRGRKRYRSRAALQATVNRLLDTAQLTGLVHVRLTEETLPNGATRWIVAPVALDEAAWAAHVERLGWHVYLTNTTPAQYDTRLCCGVIAIR